MRTLPKPLPDELLCSALARATYRYGFWSPKRFLEAVYGRRTVLAVPDLPSNLGALAEAMQQAWQLSALDLAHRHTLFGYYTYFRSERQRKQVLTAMAANGGNLHVRLGICAGSALAPTSFRLCLRCHAADVEKFREPYWHRAHHLPGVLVCHLHGEVLRETQIPFRPTGRHEYVAAPLDLSGTPLRPLVDTLTRGDLAQAVAARSFAILTASPVSKSSTPDYRVELKNLGLRSGTGGSERLRAGFVEHFGQDLLLASFRRGERLAWLAETLRAPRRPMHPFKHVLMSVYLDRQRSPVQDRAPEDSQASGKTWGLFRDAHMREEAASLARLGLRTHSVARALDVDWKTAHRLLQPVPPLPPAASRDPSVDRQAWQELASANPALGKKELRGRAPALYTRLYRHDREWLLAWQPPQQRPSTTVQRVDWEQRDLSFERQVREHIARALGAAPSRRVSRAHVLRTLGLRALLAHRAALLPRTATALGELCESVDAYQLRRVAEVLCREPGRDLPPWHVFREAGVQPSRLSDGGSSLIQRAKDRVVLSRMNEVQKGAGL